MTEEDNAGEDGEEFSSCCHEGENDGTEVTDSVKDEDLSHTS